MNVVKVCVAVFVCLFSVSAFSQQPAGVPLRGDRNIVEAKYREVSAAATASERREMVRAVSREMRADLWLVHLERFLLDHPGLSAAQRDVIVDAIGILATDLPGYQAVSLAQHHADGRMERFAARAKATLPRDLFHKAFAILGSPIVTFPEPGRTAAAATTSSKRDRWQVIGNPIVGSTECNCSDTDDFCDSVTNPMPYCNSEAGCRGLSDGCGWWWAEACDGLCSTRPDSCEGC